MTGSLSRSWAYYKEILKLIGNVLLSIVKTYVHITMFYNFKIFFDNGNGNDNYNFYNIFTI